MLIRHDTLPAAMAAGSAIKFKKSENGQDLSAHGAFPCGQKLVFELEIPRRSGIVSAEMALCRDGDDVKYTSLSYCGTNLGIDTYSLELDTEQLCGDTGCGLFGYNFRLSRGTQVIFGNARDNSKIALSHTDGEKFRLLICRADFEAPKWTRGGIMYHIFVDRFNRGSFKAPQRSDAVINPDWENGIPQFAEYPGAFVSNNEFFGGSLDGISEKLDYLKSLGVSIIYLSPIFKAYSNHRYDTGDYSQVDEMLGGDEALERLIKKAKRYGMKIILDGVFNHTGDDSKYFNKYGKYDSLGAYQSPDSPYRNWYFFGENGSYDSWWGIPIMPKLNTKNPQCRDYLLSQVISKYTKMGIGGWRLDVADELGDEFLDDLRRQVKEDSSGEGFIIGEVWENAADKVAYGYRRRYFQGDQLDSVMNYPFKNAVIGYLMTGNAEQLRSTLVSIYASYPKSVCDSLMNILGTHDTERILTVLGGENKFDLPNRELALTRLAPENRERAIKLLMLASTIQYTVYGFPSVFYGDEAGMEGYGDPFCRRPFPWGREDKRLTDHYKNLGRIRSKLKPLTNGKFKILHSEGAFISYMRENEHGSVAVAVNAGSAPIDSGLAGLDLLTSSVFDGVLSPYTAVILENPQIKEEK